MNRASVVMMRQGLPGRGDADAVCRAIRCANGLLIALTLGAGLWLLFSRS